MLGALPTAHERQLAGSAHGMTAMVEAEGITRRAPAALIGARGGGGRRQQKTVSYCRLKFPTVPKFLRKVSSMTLKTIFTAVSTALFLANAAVAGDADFTLTNRTGYDIESVYVVPSKQRDWGNDQLGKNVLADGRSRFISFKKSNNICIYDMSISWVGYSADEDVIWEKLNLCEINRITLRYNSKTNKTSITTD
jgi:hypothetical protein